jgi:hypothetical protein
MKILDHSESHIVKLSHSSVGQIFPRDIDLTLGWLPTTELQLFDINDHVASRGLINCDDGSVVRVRPPGERWPTVIAGDRHPDDYQVVWRDIPIGRILKQPGVPVGRPNWHWGVAFPGRPQPASHRATAAI